MDADVDCEEQWNQEAGDQEPGQCGHDGRAGFAEKQAHRTGGRGGSQKDRIDQIQRSDDVPNPQDWPGIVGLPVNEPCDQWRDGADKNIAQPAAGAKGAGKRPAA